MSTYQIAERWLQVEARRRANFKQQIQSIEHGPGDAPHFARSIL